MIVKSQRRYQTAMALAIAALFSLAATDAMALSLGRITVQSALGEPLRAEVDVPDINAEEAASLKTTVALPEAFRSAGLEYNPAMANLQISLQRKPDGRAYIRISSDRTINDPFVDLILEASWASGRIVRDYTMLFDPPNLRQPAPAAPTAPQISPAPASSTAAPSPSSARAAAPASAPTVTITAAPASSAATAAKSAAPAAPRAAAAPKPTAVKERNGQVAVKNGDTASKIASAAKSSSVSLDQMLVALLRANPDAFINGNINRLKAGTVVNLPSDEQAQATSASEAAQIIHAQSTDFNAYRRQLATGAPSSQVAAAERRASGNVQTQVEVKKPADAALDKLTLSKGAVQGKLAEEQIAKNRGAEDAASRAAELAKNVSELSKLGASMAAAPATAASSPAAAPGSKLETVTPTIASVSPIPAASAPAAVAAAPVAAAPKAAASAPIKPAATVAGEPGLLEELQENPLAPAGAAGLIALLIGFGFYRARQRKKAVPVDSSFMESRLQPDSFFNASGGQRIDTNDGPITGSSMVYSPSQLDAADDVDPVAEADVYLAYGRDLQAEEILKEALRTHSGRVAIHQKLLEIYAKRRDLVGFENIANEAHALTDGHGPDWERICELGLEIDPANALYQPGGHPNDGVSRPVIEPASDTPDTFPLDTVAPEPTPVAMPPSPSTLDLDLDLDFSLGDDTLAAPASTPTSDATMPSFALDLDLATAELERQDVQPSSAQREAEELTLPELSLTPEGLSLMDSDFTPPTATPEPAPPALADSGMLEFDLSSLSLELNAPAEEEGPETTPASEDPLATKLALAQEFSAIGDDDGARALIEEVIAEATGDVKVKAQEALSKLA